MAKVLLSLILLLFSGLAKAEGPSCEDVLTDIDGVDISFSLAKDMYGKEAQLQDPRTSKYYEQTIREIHKELAGGSIVLPKNVSLVLDADGSNASANAFFFEIKISERFYTADANGKKLYQNPRWMKGILIHEYFHLIFSENMRRIDPAFETVYQGLKQFQSKSRQMHEELNEVLTKLITLPYDAPERAQLQVRQKEIFEAMDQHYIQRDAWMRSTPEGIRYGLMSSFNEFFADVGAVMITKNPNEIFQALDMRKSLSGMTPAERRREFQDSQMRGFDDVHLRDGTQGEGHNLLWEARQEIWDSYLSRPSVLANQKDAVLVGVLRAISSEARWLQENGIDLSQDHALVNRRLIEAINRELQGLNGNRGPASESLADRMEEQSSRMFERPYLIDPLGEGANGRYDNDPLFRFDGFDCTTFIETMLALGRSRNEIEFAQTMNAIRYESGIVSFQTRNHFTGVDWIAHNVRAGFVRDVTARVAPEALALAQTLIEKDAWYARLGKERIGAVSSEGEKEARLQELHAFGRSAGKIEEIVPYLRKEVLMEKPELLSQIPHGSIINIVRPDWNLRSMIGTNLNVSHQGLAFWKSGVLYFRHASQTEKKVVELPLINYLRETLKSPSIGGINVLQVIDNK